MTEVGADREADTKQGGLGSLGSIVGLLVLTWAAGIASRPLNDNSFLTHLATGRLILERGTVPSRDPYTFTAFGEPWTVQSWLVSVGFAACEQVAGAVGIRVFVLALFLVAGGLLWAVTRPAESLVVRLGIVACALVAGTGTWAERPFMVGVAGIAVVWLALEGRIPGWTLVPVMWVWANSHGSYPFAILLIVAMLVGRFLDGPSLPSSQSRFPELGVLAWSAAGIVSAAIGPLGFRALTFPLVALERSDSLSAVQEWRPTEYRTVPTIAFAVLGLSALVLVSSRRQLRYAIPAIGFFFLGVMAHRNIVIACVVLAAVAATSAPSVGQLRTDSRPPGGRAVSMVVGLVAVFVCALVVVQPLDSLQGHAAHAVAFLGEFPRRDTASQERTGNFAEILGPAHGEVFFDDRFDMFPDEVLSDYLVLHRGASGWEEVLDRYEVERIVWERSTPLAELLAAHPRWAIAYSDPDYVVASRRTGR